MAVVFIFYFFINKNIIKSKYIDSLYPGTALFFACLSAQDASNITTGVLPASRGGTGRDDGASSDVYLTRFSKSADSLGMLGQRKVLDGTVDFNTVTEPGNYYVYGRSGGKREDELHRPASAYLYLDVSKMNNTDLVQDAYGVTAGNLFHRKYTSADG